MATEQITRQTGPGRSEMATEIVMTVSEQLDVDPLDLPPIQETIDGDALDTMFSGDNRAMIEFSYVDHRIRVEGRSDPTITIQ